MSVLKNVFILALHSFSDSASHASRRQPLSCFVLGFRLVVPECVKYEWGSSPHNGGIFFHTNKQFTAILGPFLRSRQSLMIKLFLF